MKKFVFVSLILMLGIVICASSMGEEQGDAHIARNGWEAEYAECIQAAVEMQRCSYAPYSHYCVGAALVTSAGKIYTGCNIENAAYSPSNCAERTAFFKAISEGERDFRLIVVTGAADSKSGSDLCTPCGICRQVMHEFCSPDFQILCPRIDEDGNVTECSIYTLEELLPDGFGPENLIK